MCLKNKWGLEKFWLKIVLKKLRTEPLRSPLTYFSYTIPLLFLVYNNGIQSELHYLKITMFANDIAFY